MVTNFRSSEKYLGCVEKTWNTVNGRKIEGNKSKECGFEGNNDKIIKLTILKAFNRKKI